MLGWYVYRRTVDPVRAKQAYTDGVRLVRATRYEQAILNFDRAIDLKADFTDAYRMRGRAYVSMGRPDNAIPDFTKVTTLQPAEPTVYVERGFAYMDKKDWDPRYRRRFACACAQRQARASLTTCARPRSGCWRSPARAIADFSRAVALEPDLDNYFQRAATYQLLNDHTHAVEDFNEAVAVAPDQPHLISCAGAIARGAGGHTGSTGRHPHRTAH